MKSSKIRRQVRIRTKLKRDHGKLRLSVYRSNKFIYAQIIDDVKGETLVAVSEGKVAAKDKMTKTDRSKALGVLIAKKATEKKITEVVFDKGSYRYHGRVKAVAEGAREGGLKF